MKTIKSYLQFTFLIITFYLLVGGASLLAAAAGDDIPYIPFWHAPWRWLISLFS